MALLKDKKFDSKGENAAKSMLKKKMGDLIDMLNKYS